MKTNCKNTHFLIEIFRIFAPFKKLTTNNFIQTVK